MAPASYVVSAPAMAQHAHHSTSKDVRLIRRRTLRHDLKHIVEEGSLKLQSFLSLCVEPDVVNGGLKVDHGAVQNWASGGRVAPWQVR